MRSTFVSLDRRFPGSEDPSSKPLSAPRTRSLHPSDIISPECRDQMYSSYDLQVLNQLELPFTLQAWQRTKGCNRLARA